MPALGQGASAAGEEPVFDMAQLEQVFVIGAVGFAGFGFSAASSITSILSSFFCLDIAIFLVETLALFLATKSLSSLISCC